MLSQIPILEQKITIPQDSKYTIARKGIQNRIEQSDKNVFLLSGKSGYGKTETIACYCRGKKEVIWFTLDKEDNNEGVFIHHFIYAAEKLEKKNSTRWMGDFQKFTKENTRKIIQNLLELAQEKKELHIVFDGLQFIKNLNILNFVKLLLENISAHIKVFMITQLKMPNCFSKYSSKGNYVGLIEKQLAFTDEEIEELIKIYYGISKVRKDYIKQIKEITLGWPVAVSLLLNAMKEKEEDIEKILWMTRKKMLLETELFGYITYEIFDILSVSFQEFLIKTAPLEELEEELCDNCLFMEGSNQMLHTLLDKGFIHMQSVKQDCTLVYFPIIRDYLLEKVDKSWQREIEKRAGIYYMEKQQYDKAFYYVKNHVEQLSIMLEQYGKSMLLKEQLDLLGDCISHMQKKEREFSIRELEVVAEYYYRMNEPEQMEKYLNIADSMFGKENKYGMYRILYRGLFRYEENPGKYGKQVNNALFFLKENQIALPYLVKSDEEVLNKILEDKDNEQKEKKENKISVTTFGTFKVNIVEDGRELSWRTKKGCEVFAYLLDKNGDAVERKTLLSELWRDEVPNNAVAMLHNMFYNIRKELSYYNLEYMIQYKSKRYTMDVSTIQSDQEVIHRISSCVENKNIVKLRKYGDMLKKYWGRYLANIDNIWVQTKQEYYDKIFEKGCKMLAYDYMEQERYEEALIYLKNALFINIYSEKIVGKILECYGKIGDLKNVKKQYEDFSTLLKKELDVEPGEDLKKTYKRCMEDR